MDLGVDGAVRKGFKNCRKDAISAGLDAIGERTAKLARRVIGAYPFIAPFLHCA